MKKRLTKVYGDYEHVKLTDEELEKLQKKFNGSHQSKIKELDEAIEMYSTYARKYKNHYLVILKWAAKSEPKEKKPWEVG